MRTRLLIVALLAFTAIGCTEKQELKENEATAINNIFKTGVGFERDPYVRAETFRVMELLADPKLAEYADDGIDDSSAMVRLASLRATLATDSPDSARAAAVVFSRGEVEERHAVLNAVAEYDEGPSRRELLGRALRSNDEQLRRIAFEESLLQRVDKAVADKDTKQLERNLYPELGRYVSLDSNPTLAALAARKFLEVGQVDRIQPMLKTLEDPDARLEDRLASARILMIARAKPAEQVFLDILARHEAVMNDDSLGIPDEVVPPALRRMAVLGAVAAGNTDYVKQAQEYINNVEADPAIEVLEALGGNESEEAAISLKVAMQDARRKVRLRAIELYQERDDADPDALASALKGADFETQERLSRVLASRFQKEWISTLRSQLQRPSTMVGTLKLLRDVVTTDKEAQALIVPLRDVLKKISTEEKDDRKALASYFLAITAENPKEAARVADALDPSTRYTYLEFLVRTSPDKHVDLFRKYLYDDLYVVRLMSAAGLWRVLGTGPREAAKPTADEASNGAEAAESAEE